MIQLNQYLSDETAKASENRELKRLSNFDSYLAENLSEIPIWDAEARRCVALLFELKEVSKNYRFMGYFSNKYESEILHVTSEIKSLAPSDLAKNILCYALNDSQLADTPQAECPFNSPFANFAWKHLDWNEPLKISEGWIRALARWHPQKLFNKSTQHPDELIKLIRSKVAKELFEETELIDEWFIDYVQKNLAIPLVPSIYYSSEPSERCVAFCNLKYLSDLRNGKYHEVVKKFAALPEFSWSEQAIDVLLGCNTENVLELVEAGINEKIPWKFSDSHRRLFALAFNDLPGVGGVLIRKTLDIFHIMYGWADHVIPLMLKDPSHPHVHLIRNMLLDYPKKLKGKKLADFWAYIATHDQGLFLPEWLEFSKGKSKPLRETAAAWLQVHRSEEAATTGIHLLNSNVTSDRLAGISFLQSSASDEDIKRLTQMHASEPTKQVRMAIAAVLAKHGVDVAPEPEKEVAIVTDIADLEASLRKRIKSIRLPKAPWLQFDLLPALKTTCGQELSPLASTFLLQCQARGKAGVIEPEVVALHPHLDRKQNAAFAHALLDQWFLSDMKAPTRWALDVAGITGDDSIIERLISPIPRWCETNHGSRAEWAAHGIGLLGTQKALSTLDSLIQRYRNHRKYVGAAASLAILRTAEMLGISSEELAERIVPDFGFDSDGEKEFSTKKGKGTAVLFHDFKIGWRATDPNQLAAKPPSTLTEEAEAELKEMRKYLKEFVSRQTLRLQDGMIGGRRWKKDVWVERYTQHPLFRILAMRLIWGVFDANGNLLRTFRLYPNGLTANASGGLEEFEEPDVSIGIPHCIDIDDATSKAWAAHLKRFKVKPLFQQLDRPTHTLAPQHHNRKEISFIRGANTTAGTLRKELLGRGWTLASAGDGGRLAGMWRRFLGCNIEAYLLVDQLHAMSSKDDNISLEEAYFATGNSAKTNYSDFPYHPLTFGEVPPIVYSETISDLKAITATKE